MFTDEQVQQDPILQYFAFDHLCMGELKAMSARFFDLAAWVVAIIPRSPERTVCLRKLLESKDAAVRATLPPFPG